jgi:hypothetical protein
MRRRIIVFLALSGFLAGGLLAWGRCRLVPPLREAEQETSRPRVQETEALVEAQAERNTTPVRGAEPAPHRDFRSAQGEPFSRSDLEASRTKPIDSFTGKQEEVVFDPGTIHPAVGDMAKRAQEIVEDLDKRTLEAAGKILEALPFVEIRPEKAELRPSGDGIKLTITVDPEDISFGKKHRNETAPSEKATSQDDGKEEKPGQ